MHRVHGYGHVPSITSWSDGKMHICVELQFLRDGPMMILKLIAEETALRCRKMNWMYQTAIIIALIPFNFFLSIIAYLGAILMVNIPVIEWLVISPKFHVYQVAAGTYFVSYAKIVLDLAFSVRLRLVKLLTMSPAHSNVDLK